MLLAKNHFKPYRVQKKMQSNLENKLQNGEELKHFSHLTFPPLHSDINAQMIRSYQLFLNFQWYLFSVTFKNFMDMTFTV